jgi:cellulose synthase/poly-beta-1,6-N-acetylglucosamine synthase-like glycosyltransferase
MDDRPQNTGARAMSEHETTAALRTVVLVPTLNDTPDLERCLAALQAQDHRGFEVLVVDSRPSAAGQALAERYGARYLPDDNRSRATACNHALSVLDCDVVVFTDDDCYPPPEWLSKLVRHFARPEVAGVGGPHIAPNDQGFWGRVVDVAFASPLLSIGLRYAKTWKSVREVPHNPGCNAAYRKAALDEVGGFTHAPFGCEDVALDCQITRRGHRLWFDPEAITYHRRRDRFGTLARQMYAYGKGRADTNARFPSVATWAHLLPSAIVIASGAVVAISVFAFLLSTLQPAHSMWAPLVVTLPLWGLLAFYCVATASAARSPSPYRSFSTVFAAPLVMALSIIQYGRGFLHWHRVFKPRFVRGQL